VPAPRPSHAGGVEDLPGSWRRRHTRPRRRWRRGNEDSRGPWSPPGKQVWSASWAVPTAAAPEESERSSSRRGACRLARSSGSAGGEAPQCERTRGTPERARARSGASAARQICVAPHALPRPGVARPLRLGVGGPSLFHSVCLSFFVEWNIGDALDVRSAERSEADWLGFVTKRVRAQFSAVRNDFVLEAPVGMEEHGVKPVFVTNPPLFPPAFPDTYCGGGVSVR